jgi:hypothetical protein
MRTARLTLASLVALALLGAPAEAKPVIAR